MIYSYFRTNCIKLSSLFIDYLLLFFIIFSTSFVATRRSSEDDLVRDRERELLDLLGELPLSSPLLITGDPLL